VEFTRGNFPMDVFSLCDIYFPLIISLFDYYIYVFLDINECSASKPCEQECKNTAGSYTCSCKNGFVKNAKDATKCVGKILRLYT